MKNIVPTLREIRHEKSSLSVILISCIMAGFILLAFLVVTPVPFALPENCKMVRGKVTRVFSPCCADVVIELAGDSHNYHINRGLERGIDLDVFNAELIEEEVTLQYIRTHWTPLDPFGELRPVAQVSLGNKVLYSAFPSQTK